MSIRIRLMGLLLCSSLLFSGCGLLWFGAGAATGAAIDDDDDGDLG